jgi:hypothetical protein
MSSSSAPVWDAACAAGAVVSLREVHACFTALGRKLSLDVGGGIDQRILDQLEQAGLLTPEPSGSCGGGGVGHKAGKSKHRHGKGASAEVGTWRVHPTLAQVTAALKPSVAQLLKGSC